MDTKLTDESAMPFGKHKGEKMENVPARYLLWLWEDGHWSKPAPLHDYIAESFSALSQESRDFIVTHFPK